LINDLEESHLIILSYQHLLITYVINLWIERKKILDLSSLIAISLFHQVSDKRLARAGRAEATLSPQGGGRDKVRPGRPGSRKVTEARGSQIGQRRKAAREKTGGRRAEDRGS
jgi:hypothetical protein